MRLLRILAGLVGGIVVFVLAFVVLAPDTAVRLLAGRAAAWSGIEAQGLDTLDLSLTEGRISGGPLSFGEGAGPPARVGQFRADLDARALFAGRIVVEELFLADAHAELAIDDQGRAKLNGIPLGPSAEQGAREEKQEDGGARLPAIDIAQASLEQVRLDLRRGSGPSFPLLLDRLRLSDLSAETPDVPAKFEIAGSGRDVRFSYTGEMKPYGRPIEVGPRRRLREPVAGGARSARRPARPVPRRGPARRPGQAPPDAVGGRGPGGHEPGHPERKRHRRRLARLERAAARPGAPPPRRERDGRAGRAGGVQQPRAVDHRRARGRLVRNRRGQGRGSDPGPRCRRKPGRRRRHRRQDPRLGAASRAHRRLVRHRRGSPRRRHAARRHRCDRGARRGHEDRAGRWRCGAAAAVFARARASSCPTAGSTSIFRTPGSTSPPTAPRASTEGRSPRFSDFALAAPVPLEATTAVATTRSLHVVSPAEGVLVEFRGGLDLRDVAARVDEARRLRAQALVFELAEMRYDEEPSAAARLTSDIAARAAGVRMEGKDAKPFPVRDGTLTLAGLDLALTADGGIRRLALAPETEAVLEGYARGRPHHLAVGPRPAGDHRSRPGRCRPAHPGGHRRHRQRQRPDRAQRAGQAVHPAPRVRLHRLGSGPGAAATLPLRRRLHRVQRGERAGRRHRARDRRERKARRRRRSRHPDAGAGARGQDGRRGRARPDRRAGGPRHRPPGEREAADRSLAAVLRRPVGPRGRLLRRHPHRAVGRRAPGRHRGRAGERAARARRRRCSRCRSTPAAPR